MVKGAATEAATGNKPAQRIRGRLLVLLWIWALLVFAIVDLFWNVREFDRIRPRSTLYRAARYVAHELVGETYYGGEFGDHIPPQHSTRTAPTPQERVAALPRDLRERALGELRARVGSEQHTESRIYMVRALAEAFGADARTDLITIARDPEQRRPVRAEAARLVGRTGDGALAALRSILAADLPRRVHEGAVIGLAEVGTAEAAEQALDIAGGGSSPLQAMAVRALGKFGRPAAAPVLAAAARGEALDADIRVAVCASLGRADAVEDLAAIAIDGGMPVPVRIAAVIALEDNKNSDSLAALKAVSGASTNEVAQRARLAWMRTRAQGGE